MYRVFWYLPDSVLAVSCINELGTILITRPTTSWRMTCLEQTGGNYRYYSNILRIGVHIIYSIILTIQNRRARGKVRYDSESKTMLHGLQKHVRAGSVILLLLYYTIPNVVSDAV